MVKTGYTGKHIATTLINCMLDEMKKINGVKGCGIMVHPINKNAIKMYEKIGFKFEKTQVYSFGEFHTYVYIFKK